MTFHLKSIRVRLLLFSVSNNFIIRLSVSFCVIHLSIHSAVTTSTPVPILANENENFRTSIQKSTRPAFPLLNVNMLDCFMLRTTQTDKRVSLFPVISIADISSHLDFRLFFKFDFVVIVITIKTVLIAKEIVCRKSKHKLVTQLFGEENKSTQQWLLYLVLHQSNLPLKHQKLEQES